MFDIEKAIRMLPTNPGVYIMRDKEDKIIYVGKAINLKNRVRSYFRNTSKSPRIEKMVSLIDHFEYIVVDNENEALILESNLIKENRPRFNVLLKDDKSYPYIKFDTTSKYPRVYLTRKIINDGSKYFGPYSNVASANEILNFIKERYQLVLCSNYLKKKRPCLNYHIGRCMGPCFKKIDDEKYRKNSNEILKILEGKTEFIENELKEKMNEASNNLDFESAARYRDKLKKIQMFDQKQKVSNMNENSIDVIGIARDELEVCIEIFFVRQSKMVGRDHYFFDQYNDMSDKEILSGFIKQYYFNNPNIPKKIMLREQLEEKDAIEKLFSDMAHMKIELKSPKIGEKIKFVEMAESNAKITLRNRQKDKYEILNELRDVLGLDKRPKRIESYDISNISGSDSVGAMCVMIDGHVKKNLSRRFIIKTVEGQDDTACMIEIISRRIRHFIENEDDGFGELPDVILADGGIGQIHAIEKALKNLNVSIPVFGMVKNDKHQTRALINNKREELEISENLKNIITNFQDVVHDTAITFHRKRRDQKTTKSILDEIDRIGDVKKKDLIKYFSSIENIKNASLDELQKVKGINLNLALKIKEKLNV